MERNNQKKQRAMNAIKADPLILELDEQLKELGLAYLIKEMEENDGKS